MRPHQLVLDFVRARRSWIAASAGAALLVVATLCCGITFRGPTGVTLRDDRGAQQRVSLPYVDANASTTRPMEFSFHLRRGVLTPTFFVFVPDDHLLSISVGGRDLPLAAIPPAKLDDWNNGFSYPLGRSLEPGDNVVVVQVLNRGGGQGGFGIHPDPEHGVALLEVVIAAIAALLLLGAGVRVAGCRWTTVILAALALSLRLAYLWVTPWTLREHDAAHHLEYVHYLLDHHSFPKAVDGWAFYHPPFYFIVSAGVYALFEATGFGGHTIEGILQIESIVFELGFAAFAIATCRLWITSIPGVEPTRRFLGREGLATLCAALILFWPTSVMHSVRIGNDDLTYLWFGAAMYFASRWWLAGRDARRRDFFLATASAAIGVVTKTNALVLFIVLGLMLLARVFGEREGKLRTFARYAVPFVLLFVVSAGLAMHESLVAAVAGKQSHLFVGNAERCNQALALDNRPLYFLWFDFRTFLKFPFTSAWDDAKGRQWFWNYLLKTSLFGEWEFSQPPVKTLATALSWVCLAMCPVVVSGALLRRRAELARELPLSAMAVVLLVSLAVQRVNMPVFHGDFRYVFPLMAPLGFWYVAAAAVSTRRRWRWPAWAVVSLGWTAVVLSVAFVVAVVVTSS